jgi:hypothetical protein
VPFGQDERGPWKGFQLWRPDFDAILLDGAGRAGALIVRPCGELHPIVRGNRVAGVETIAGTWLCAFVIDATGRQRWLARAFNLLTERHGPPQVAWFGYAEGHRPALDPNPMIASDASGWTWMARIRPSLYQWVRLPLHGARPPTDWRPVEAGLQPMHQRRGIDVSWTIANPTAGPGYFLTGDVASIVDPLSSHGILKAVMSGMKAAHHSAAVLRCAVSRECLPRLARTVVLSGPLSPRRTLSRYWPVAWVMIGNGEHFGVKSRPNGRRGYLISKPNYSSSPAAGTTTNATRSAKRSSTKTTRS